MPTYRTQITSLTAESLDPNAWRDVEADTRPDALDAALPTAKAADLLFQVHIADPGTPRHANGAPMVAHAYTVVRAKDECARLRSKWFKFPMANGCIRHRLYINGSETPYFIDEAKLIGHRTYGHKFGLFGAGLGNEVRTARGSYRIAAVFGGFDRISEAKKRAESLNSSGIRTAEVDRWKTNPTT